MIPDYLAAFALALAGAGAVQAPKSKPNAPKSIESGLAWLARHQNPDGSWGGNSLMQRCTGEKPCYGTRAALSGHFDEGLTGLAVLCFLRAGSLDVSAQEIVDPASGKPVNAAAAVRSGLTWLKKIQKKSGSFSRERSFLYNDAVADQSKLDVKDKSLSGALDFLNYATKTNGLVGYDKSENAGKKVTGPFDLYDYHVATMSSIGILIRSSVGKDRTNAFYDLAVKEILKDLPQQSSDGLSIDYYYWYHGTLALNRLEGSEGPKKAKRKVAEPWNQTLLETLTALQDRTKEACRHGGWVVPDRWSLYAAGPVYSTAMGVLALEAVKKK